MTAIKRGIYKSVGTTTPLVLPRDSRTTKVKLDSGIYVDIVNPDYISNLEQQILELKKLLAIQDQAILRIYAQIKRHGAAIRKLDT